MLPTESADSGVAHNDEDVLPEKILSDSTDSVIAHSPKPEKTKKTKRNSGQKKSGGKGQYSAGNNRRNNQHLPPHYLPPPPMYWRPPYMQNGAFYPPPPHVMYNLPPPGRPIPLIPNGHYQNGYNNGYQNGYYNGYRPLYHSTAAPPHLSTPMFCKSHSNSHGRSSDEGDRVYGKKQAKDMAGGEDSGRGDTVLWDSSDDESKLHSEFELIGGTAHEDVVLEKKWETSDNLKTDSLDDVQMVSSESIMNGFRKMKGEFHHSCSLDDYSMDSPVLDEENDSKEDQYSMKNEPLDPALSAFPLIYVSSAGTISVVLTHNIVIEMSVDRSVRVVCHDEFAAFLNNRGTSSSILHRKGRLLHHNENVYSKFTSSNEKMAVFGVQGVLFTMGHLTEAYLVSSNIKGASSVALDKLEFAPLDIDYTVKLFYKESQTGDQFIRHCQDVVGEATYFRKPDGTLVMHINGLCLRQKANGDLSVDARPRHINCSPSAGTVRVRSSYVDMGIQENEKGFIKRGLKRVHVSSSGMVVSDGNCITSMDHFGRIVSCT